MQLTYKHKKRANKISTSKWIGLICLGIYCLINLFDNMGSYFTNLSSTIDYYIVPSLFLIFIIGITVWIPKKHGIGKMRYRSTIRVSAVSCAVGWLMANIVAGFLFGFGQSPYDRSIRGILLNIGKVGTALVAREYIRSYLINYFCKDKNQKSLIWITVVMTAIQLNINACLRLSSLKDVVLFSAEQFLPLLGQNILASYLCAYGGMTASLIYLGMLMLGKYSSPILPDINWFVTGIVGMSVPLISMSCVVNTYEKMSHQIKIGMESNKNILKEFILDFSCILFIWFVVGVFTIYPSAIVTGSMKPLIDPGDVILIKKLKSQEELEQLKVGEIIQFKSDNILVTHRIVDIRRNEKTNLKEFQTKGDNNSGVDIEWVEMKNIKGTLEGIIPKIGWPTIWVKDVRNKEIEGVEF